MSVATLFSGAFEALAQGARLGLSPNPLAGVLTAALAAALGGHPRATRDQRVWAWSTIVLGWLLGDGLRVLARARDAADGVGSLLGEAAPAFSSWVLLAAWAAIGLAVGYLLPAMVGWAVGRRVTHGTGWLSAGATAVGVSLALSTLLAAL